MQELSISPPDPDEIKLVQSSWKSIDPKRDEVASQFYENLFELSPEVKPLFEDTDMVQQGKKLTDTMTVAVKGLQHFSALIPALGELGNRHVKYGVKEEHYAAVRTALIMALDKVLGNKFDPATRIAWEKTYDSLADIMKGGLQENPAPV